MGQLKQLLPYRDSTMLDAVLEAVMESSVDGLIIVANQSVADHLAGRLPSEGCTMVLNENPDSAMLESVQMGLRTLLNSLKPAPDDGVMVLLADQPQITGGVITSCAEAFRLPKKPPGILIATYKGRRAHPTIFRVDVLNEVTDWPPERRLNELAVLHPDLARELPITTVPLPIDVDTPDDYLRLRGDSE